jgi:hypothetical protein
MKPTILIYCGEDGEAGKALAASLRDGKSHVVMCAAGAFSGVQYLCERIVFTRDVPQRLRSAIEAAHGVKAEVAKASAPVSLKHRGFGRWFLMRGDEVVSGPHTKEAAAKLAA